MKINYYGSILEVELSDWYHRRLILHSIYYCIFRRIRERALQKAIELIGSKDSPIIIDIGSNIGAFSIPLSIRYPNAQIISIDPHPIASGRFIRNVRYNNSTNIRFVSAAIAPENQLRRLHSCYINSGGHRLTGFSGREHLSQFDTNRMPKKPFWDSIYIPSLPLSDILEQFELSHIDLLKSDVEGYEYQVLSSLGKHLNPNHVSYVIAEYGPEGMSSAGHTGLDLVKLMKDSGYLCVDIKSNEKIETEHDISSIPNFSGVTDFLFYPN